MGPVTRMMPCGIDRAARSFSSCSRVKPKHLKSPPAPSLCSNRNTTLSPYTVGTVDTRRSSQTPLTFILKRPSCGNRRSADIQIRQYLDPRNNRRSNLGWGVLNLTHDAIDAVSNLQALLERFDMDI